MTAFSRSFLHHIADARIEIDDLIAAPVAQVDDAIWRRWRRPVALSTIAGLIAGFHRIRRALVVAEVALAVMLVIGAGLLIRTVYNLRFCGLFVHETDV